MINSEEMKERERDILSIKKIIPNVKDIQKTEKYYPVMFFDEGLNCYVNGFDVASIFYLSLSIELALLTRLGKNITERKDRDFKKMIDKASNSTIGILDTETKVLADDIRKLRNCYVHFYNNLYYSFLENKKMIEIYKKLGIERKDISEKVIKSRISFFEKRIKSLENIIPNLSEIVDSEIKEFLEKWFLEFDYFRFQKIVEEEYLKAEGLQDSNSIPYSKNRFDAKTQIGWCFKLLKYLNFL